MKEVQPLPNDYTRCLDTPEGCPMRERCKRWLDRNQFGLNDCSEASMSYKACGTPEFEAFIDVEKWEG